MAPKYVKSSDSDDTFEIGRIKLVRIGGTIYLYTSSSVHPLMTRKFGDARIAMVNFNTLKRALERIGWGWYRPIKSRWRKLKERLGFV